MHLKPMVFFLLCLESLGVSIFASVEIMPAGITCCSEEKIRSAMAEEALSRVLAKTEAGIPKNNLGGDYLSEQAYGKIIKHLPPGLSPDQRLDYMRQLLGQPALDRDVREFQILVGHFVLGMTLEIGHTLQDEYDQALNAKEKIEKLLVEIEKIPLASEANLGRELSHAQMTEKELNRLRSIERKWQEAVAGASPFDQFNVLKKNVTGRGPDPEQRLVFALGERYRSHYPFLDEFLANYLRLAVDFRVLAGKLNMMWTSGNR